LIRSGCIHGVRALHPSVTKAADSICNLAAGLNNLVKKLKVRAGIADVFPRAKARSLFCWSYGTTKVEPLHTSTSRWRICLTVALLFLSGGSALWAHIGPPYPIMQNRKIGPLTVEVWSNPDVGTGSFFIVIDPPKGGSVPSDMKVQVSVQPVSGRLPKKTYDAWREKLRDRVEFKSIVPFDKEETWKVEVTLSSAEVSGATATNVEVTPALLGRWDLLLFLLPFLGVGFLWFKAVTTKRRYRRAREKTSPNLD